MHQASQTSRFLEFSCFLPSLTVETLEWQIHTTKSRFKWILRFKLRSSQRCAICILPSSSLVGKGLGLVEFIFRVIYYLMSMNNLSACLPNVCRGSRRALDALQWNCGQLQANTGLVAAKCGSSERTASVLNGYPSLQPLRIFKMVIFKANFIHILQCQGGAHWEVTINLMMTFKNIVLYIICINNIYYVIYYTCVHIYKYTMVDLKASLSTSQPITDLKCQWEDV